MVRRGSVQLLHDYAVRIRDMVVAKLFYCGSCAWMRVSIASVTSPGDGAFDLIWAAYSVFVLNCRGGSLIGRQCGKSYFGRAEDIELDRLFSERR
jgi:hypothetical protein